MLKKGIHVHIILCLIGIGLGLQKIVAQDLSFTQFRQSPLLNNPASFDTRFQGKIALQYRYQPIATGEQLSTPILYGQYSLYQKDQKKPFGTLGAMFMRDQAGNFLMTQGLSLAYAYHLNLPRSRWSFALQGGWFQKRFDLNQISTDNQFTTGFYDPEASINESFDNTQVSYFSYSIGLQYRYLNAQDQERGYFGLAWRNFNQATLNFLDNNPSTLPEHFNISAGWIIPTRGPLEFEPNARLIYRLDQAYALVGSWLHYDWSNEEAEQNSLGAGLWYNSNQAMVMGVKWEKDRYALNISYDLPISQKSVNWLGNGAIEFGLSLRFPAPHQRPKKLVDPILDDLSTLTHKTEVQNPMQTPKLENDLKNREFLDVQRLGLSPEIRMNRDKQIALSRQNLPKDVAVLNAQHVQFELSRDTLKQGYLNYLDNVITVLNKYPNLQLVVSGHTCDLGEASENLSLSKERASYVKNYLVRKEIPADRVIIIGLGEQTPLVPNISDLHRQINRRVEFEFILIDP